MFRLTSVSAFLAVAIGVAMAMTVVLTQRYVDGQVDIGRQYRDDMLRWRATVDTRLRDYDARLDSLDREVFGQEEAAKMPAPPAPVVAAPEAWQKNRDRELRRRIESLERRLYDLKGQ